MGDSGVAPDYITYNRHFKHNETFMGYKNGREFYDNLCELATDHNKRKQIGLNAARMVDSTRTERVNAQTRFDLYESIIEGNTKSYRFIPNKRKEDGNKQVATPA